jgi:muramidase (phage lysozyme)
VGSELEQAIKLITTPLSEGLASGQDAPSTGQERTDQGAYPDTQPYSGSGDGSRVGSKEQRALLDAIAFAEGTRDRANGGYNTMFTGKQFSGYEDHPRKINRSRRYASDAAGRYQFLSTTWDRLAKKIGLKDFSPESQDRAALELVKELGVSDNILKNEGISPKVSRIIGKQWASFPGSPFGQPIKPLNSIQKAYTISLGSPQPTQSQTQSTPGTGQSFRPLPQGSFKGGERQRYLASRDRGKRKHLGIDITESNWKRGSDPKIPVVAIRGGVVSSRYYLGGTKYDSGMVIDQDDGYSVRYLHMTPSVRPGQKVSAGQRIGRLVDLGDQTHLHIELFSGSKRLDPTDYIKTVERGGVPPSIARQQSPTPSPAQIASTQTQQRQQLAQQIAQERFGPTVIISETPTPPPQIISSGNNQTSMLSIEVSEFDLLNRFMKNKLLLDLTYL